MTGFQFFLLFIGALVFTLAVLALTIPNEAPHPDAVKAVVGELAKDGSDILTVPSELTNRLTLEEACKLLAEWEKGKVYE